MRWIIKGMLLAYSSLKMFLKSFFKTGLIYTMNYMPIIKIMNTAVINENSEQLYFMLIIFNVNESDINVK